MTKPTTAMIAAAAIFAIAAAIDAYAHGWWTYTRTYDETWSAYVRTAEHRDYRVVGINTRTPLIDFAAMGVDPDSATDGTLQ